MLLNWNEYYYPYIIDLNKALGPIRLAAETSIRRDCNLFKSEGNFIIILAKSTKYYYKYIYYIFTCFKK